MNMHTIVDEHVAYIPEPEQKENSTTTEYVDLVLLILIRRYLLRCV